MSKKITLTVSSCYECPHSTNNAREHNDPFTSGPVNIYWYCRHPKRNPSSKWIDDVNKVDPKCPENQEAA